MTVEQSQGGSVHLEGAPFTPITAVGNDGRTTAMQRTAEMAAIFMIGDGFLGLAQPERHVNLWRSAYPSLDLLVRPFAGKALRRRVYGIAQVTLGLLLVARLKTPIS